LLPSPPPPLLPSTGGLATSDPSAQKAATDSGGDVIVIVMIPLAVVIGFTVIAALYLKKHRIAQFTTVVTAERSKDKQVAVPASQQMAVPVSLDIASV
jgi:hypothetical protein